MHVKIEYAVTTYYSITQSVDTESDEFQEWLNPDSGQRQLGGTPVTPEASDIKDWLEGGEDPWEPSGRPEQAGEPEYRIERVVLP